MDVVSFSTQELSALMDLPLIQRVAYLMGIRPFMDGQTQMVGIKRKISYQSLREVLYVAPIPGSKADQPSLPQVRRAVKALERAGLIALHSSEKHLILKCLLVNEYTFVQNKAGMRPTGQADIRAASNGGLKPTPFDDIHSQAGIGATPQADTPLYKNNYLYFLFIKFWESYPQKNSKPLAWIAFQRINPSEELFEKMLAGLGKQIEHHNAMQAQGTWMPSWKYPANWLEQHCWEDELQTTLTQEKHHHGTGKYTGSKASSRDVLWESCKSGLDYDKDGTETGAGSNTNPEDKDNNIIELSRYRASTQKG